MTFRLPQSLSGHLRPETGWGVLDYELHQQKAQTLGDLGAQVEQALAALHTFDAGPQGRTERPDALICWMVPPIGYEPSWSSGRSAACDTGMSS